MYLNLNNLQLNLNKGEGGGSKTGTPMTPNQFAENMCNTQMQGKTTNPFPLFSSCCCCLYVSDNHNFKTVYKLHEIHFQVSINSLCQYVSKLLSQLLLILELIQFSPPQLPDIENLSYYVKSRWNTHLLYISFFGQFYSCKTYIDLSLLDIIVAITDSW